MQNHKRVRDIMVDSADIPSIRNWGTIRQAIQIMSASLPRVEKNLHPIGLLVLDDQDNLLGTLSLKDIVKGLEPNFMRPLTKADVYQGDEQELSLIWDALFEENSFDFAEKPVHEYLVPAQFHVEPDDPVTKAAYVMTYYDLAFLPVLAGGKKFVGIVRLTDIFDTLSHAILNAVKNK